MTAAAEHTKEMISKKCRGAALGGIVGDAVGAATEGWSHKEVLAEYPAVDSYRLVPSSHMGVYDLPPRKGCYTDDTNSALAIASSIVQLGGRLNASHVAYTHARHFFDGFSMPVLRGYPDSAKAMIQATLAGKSGHECATIAFKDGSFANGAAMKVWPVPLAFRGVSDTKLRDVVTASCAFSHVHPIGVDAAVVQAKAVAMALSAPPASPVDPEHLLPALHAVAGTNEMKAMLGKLKDELRSMPPPSSDFSTEAELLYAAAGRLLTPNQLRFQIEGTGAVACSLLAFARHSKDPMAVIAHAIALGGDTDTIASMAGACAGALHGGDHWVPAEILGGLENGDRGLDWALGLVDKLADMESCELDALDAPRPKPSPVDVAWEHCNRYFAQFRSIRHKEGDLSYDRYANFSLFLGEVWDRLAAGSSSASLESCSAVVPAISGSTGSELRTAALAAIGAVESGAGVTKSKFVSFFLGD